MEPLIFEVAWKALLEWLDVPQKNAEPMRAEVLARYREPERAYHNLGHALKVLRDVKQFARLWGVEDYGAVQIAALLHDVIYDTHRKDNEARSAEFVLQWGRELGIAGGTCQHAADIIRATQHHISDNDDASLVLDADMAILAAPWEVYDIYRRAIRREYHWVTETDWIAGRGKVLSGFLEQELIFQTPALRNGLERPARENLARELSLL